MLLFCTPCNLFIILKPGAPLKTKLIVTGKHMLSSLTPLKPLMAFQCFSGFPLLSTLEKTLLTQAAAACVFWPLPPAQLCLSRPPRLSGRPQGRSSSWAQAFCTCSSPWPGYFWPFYFREILLDPPDLIRRLSMRGFTLCHLTSTAG